MMKIKVCGLKEVGNIMEVNNLGVDYLGFIFYKKSSRYIELNHDLIQCIRNLKQSKVGVFVNEDLDEIVRLKSLLGLDYIQLHGNESVDFCKELQVFSKLIKVFKVDDEFDFLDCEQFRFADYFLFETKGKLEGGNGTQFNWQILEEYHMKVPFFLSGGIRPEDVEALKNIKHDWLSVVDVNSGVEIEPGLKNVELINKFKNELSSR